MELRDRAPEALTRFRFRLLASSLALIALAFTQAPGFLTFDTKFDLVVDPWHYMQRGLHLWDSNGAIGQLQNQAYGYLWPMGPFFGLGQSAQIPAWAVQRLFMALVLCVAFLGVAKLARALGVRSDLACLVAGFAYALSPRLVSTVGTISIESWPSALAPWVLLPLVVGSAQGSPRRAAALSALAVAMIGGVNATASFAALPVAAIWLLTREPGPRRRQLMFWWPIFTAMGTLWWLIPLFLLGAYSPPFLDFIESASVTTQTTDVFDALRGTSHWLPYVDSRWLAGNDLVTKPNPVINSGVVLMLGFIGLMHRRNPHRFFLSVSLFVGLLLVTMGHLGSVQGWFAPNLHEALDGVLAAARNVHKFDPIVRLPLVLGMALLLDALRAPEYSAEYSAGSRQPGLFVGVSILAVAALVGAALPAIQGRMAPDGRMQEVPSYWEQAGAWLDRQGHEGAALMAPGIGVAKFVWGTPNDEPLEFLVKKGRFGVRSNIPFVPPGNIRALDAIETRLARGEPSSGLATYLARAGIQYLVVRNDVQKLPDIPDTVLLHQALDDSPGLVRVKSFGPELGGAAHLDTGGDRNVINGGWQTNYRAIEIYEVSLGGPGAVAATELPLVVGGPESLLGLTDAGLLGQQPTVLASDADPRERPTGPVILTDGYRDKERFYGQLHDGYSSVLLPGEPNRSGNPHRDYYINKGDDRWRTRGVLEGISTVGSTSSMADSTAPGGARPAHSAFAAIDGDPTTEWVSYPNSVSRPTWRVTFRHQQQPRTVAVTAGASLPGSRAFRVVTEAGKSTPFRLGPSRRQDVVLPTGPTRWLAVEAAGDSWGGGVALSEVMIPGITARKTLALPAIPKRWGAPVAVMMEAALDARSGCVRVDASVRCLENRDVQGEEESGFHRLIQSPAEASYEPQLTIRSRAGTAVEKFLLEDFPVSVTSSSQGVPDARASALAAVDGDPGTTWIARRDDLRPEIEFRWVGRREVRGLSIAVDADAAARTPLAVRLHWGAKSRVVDLDADGTATFPPIRTDNLGVEIVRTSLTTSIGFDQSQTQIGTGISEVRLRGAPFQTLQPSEQRRTLPCGTGPDVTLNGETHRTRVSASPSEVFNGTDITASLCESPQLTLREGENRLSVSSTPVFKATRMVLRAPNFALAAPTPVQWGNADADSRTATPPVGSRFLVFRENGNPGWTARQGGANLKPVRADGWQQGWRLEPGVDAPVIETYAPEKPYRFGLVIGFLSMGLLILMVAYWSWRPPSGDPPPVAGRSPINWPLVWTGAVVVLGLVGGWPGVFAALAGYLLAGMAGRWTSDAGSWIPAGFIPAAALFYALQPWGSGSWAGGSQWPQLLCVAALGALIYSLDVRPKFRRRIAGISTKR